MAGRLLHGLHDMASVPSNAGGGALGDQPMLAPVNAWRILRRRTGGGVSRATFYRWLSNGKIYSVRVGFRIFVPWPALEDLIRRCLAGERY